MGVARSERMSVRAAFAAMEASTSWCNQRQPAQAWVSVHGHPLDDWRERFEIVPYSAELAVLLG
jgi:hypothetical protein